MTDDGKVKPLRKVADAPPLDPLQAELIADLTELLARARAGELTGLVGVVITSDEDIEPIIAGALYSVGDTFMHLHIVADMLKVGYTDEDDDEDS